MSSSPILLMPLLQLRTLNREQLLGVLAVRLQPAVVVAATIGITWQLAQLTWLVMEPKAAITPIPVAAPTLRSTSPAVNTQSISDAHLFGLANAAPETDLSTLPQTQINLVLAGTIAFNDPQTGFAIVGENASSAKFYKVGGMINGGIRLHSVYADRVIIDRAGTLETLALPRGPTTGMPAVNRPVQSPGAQLGDNIRRIAANNPSALAQMLRIQPVFSNGAQKGYRVYPGRDRAQFARLGLQPGDLITSINGMSLNDAGAPNDILGLLSSSTSVVVSVERNGSPMQLNLDVTQISIPEEGEDGPSPIRGERTQRSQGIPGPPSTQ